MKHPFYRTKRLAIVTPIAFALSVLAVGCLRPVSSGYVGRDDAFYQVRGLYRIRADHRTRRVLPAPWVRSPINARPLRRIRRRPQLEGPPPGSAYWTSFNLADFAATRSRWVRIPRRDIEYQLGNATIWARTQPLHPALLERNLPDILATGFHGTSTVPDFFGTELGRTSALRSVRADHGPATVDGRPAYYMTVQDPHSVRTTIVAVAPFVDGFRYRSHRLAALVSFAVSSPADDHAARLEVLRDALSRVDFESR